MDNFKTFFSFEDGNLINQPRKDWEISLVASAAEIKVFLSELVEKHTLSGRIFIEIKNGLYFVDFDLIPREFEQILRTELKKKFFVFEQSELMERKLLKSSVI